MSRHYLKGRKFCLLFASLPISHPAKAGRVEAKSKETSHPRYVPVLLELSCKSIKSILRSACK